MPSPADPPRIVRSLEARLLEARAARLRPPSKEERKLLTSVVTFRRSKGNYALALEELREIRPLTRLCLIPGASSVVPGVVHYRGELLSLHDLASFGGHDPSQLPAAWMLVVEKHARRIGLMADEVMDVVDIEVGGIQPVPLTLVELGELLSGLTRENILVLDAAKLFQSTRFMSAF